MISRIVNYAIKGLVRLGKKLNSRPQANTERSLYDATIGPLPPGVYLSLWRMNQQRKKN